ncbi:hypothetical protein BAE44_0002927, partial [Dichanthelium oligosanthes]
LARSALCFFGRYVWLVNPPGGVCNSNSIIN